MIDKTINIVYATDDNNVDLLKISMYSLLRNANPSTFYSINILHRCIKSESIKELEDVCRQFPNSHINFIDCTPYEKKYHFTDEELKQLKVRVFLPSVTFYRLLTFEIFPNVRRIIYLDNDTLILKDLSTLFETKIDTLLGMVKEAEIDAPGFGYDIKNGTIQHFWYNNGVMVINLHKLGMNTESLFKLALERKTDDQRFVNYYFYDNITSLNFYQNFMLVHGNEVFSNVDPNTIPTPSVLKEIMMLTDEQRMNIFSNAYIVHYIHWFTRTKPTDIFNKNSNISSKEQISEYLNKLALQKDDIGRFLKFVFRISSKYKTYRKAFILWGEYWLDYQDFIIKCGIRS